MFGNTTRGEKRVPSIAVSGMRPGNVGRKVSHLIVAIARGTTPLTNAHNQIRSL